MLSFIFGACRVHIYIIASRRKTNAIRAFSAFCRVNHVHVDLHCKAKGKSPLQIHEILSDNRKHTVPKFDI